MALGRSATEGEGYNKGCIPFSSVNPVLDVILNTKNYEAVNEIGQHDQ